MLVDAGAAFVLIGHSERRKLFHETSHLINLKLKRALACGLYPILCVGETADERQTERTRQVLASQLYDLPSQDFAIAYEPVWAIGSGHTATRAQAQEVHAFIRGRVAGHDASIAAGLSILYGGSCKAANAAELFGMPDIDGGLIGGASLKAEEFLAIWSAAAKG